MRRPRHRGWWPAAGGGAILGIAVTLLLTGFGRAKPSEQDERWHVLCDHNPNDPCPGTTPALVKTCSCEPQSNASFNALCFLDQHMRQEVVQCFTGRIELPGMGTATRTCVETRVQTDPEAKALFLQAADDAMSLDPSLTAAWNDCYRCWSTGQDKGCTKAASP